MKKILLSILCIAFGFCCFAQSNNLNDEYHPLVQEGKMWCELIASEIPHPDPESPLWAFEYNTIYFLFHGDTTINDKEYKKLFTASVKDPVFPDDWSLKSLWREDDNKRVWKFNQLTEEILLYDFALQIGNTVPSEIFDLLPITVEDITYEMMHNGEMRKVIWFTPYSSYLSYDLRDYWIEGMGNHAGLERPITYGIVGGFNNLLCHYENDQLIYKDSFWNTCYKTGNSVGIDTYDSQMNIYPNPVKDILYIDHTDKMAITGICLVNIFGQTVKQFEPNMNPINISDIPSGIYFLKLKTSTEEIIRKLIIY